MRKNHRSCSFLVSLSMSFVVLPGCGGDGDDNAVGDAGTTGDGAHDVMGDGHATGDGDAGGDGHDTGDSNGGGPVDPDVNGDGTLNILVLGTSVSLKPGAEAFDPTQIAAELQSILSADAAISVDVNVVAEDIYLSKQVLTGLGADGTEYDWTYYRHSLAQYYYWPEGRDERMKNLAGSGDVDWDQVVIGADPYIVSVMPGYYALGVNKVAAKVAEGGAQPLLLMMWPRSESSGASIDHFAEFTYRTAHGAKVPLPTVPAGRAWQALPAAKKDSAVSHPTPNGAYLAAATIYARLYGRSASSSDYVYDDELADAALSTVNDEVGNVHYAGHPTFVSPFKSCDITDRVLNYNHTGTSSEKVILSGLKWVCAKAQVQLQEDGAAPIDFNYGRANTGFEPEKRYQIDPSRFDFSLGFPMQDNPNHGESLLYGLDKRNSDSENGTDLGVARKMIRDSELPYGRTIPVRTLFAQMKEINPAQSAYSDWHMSSELTKAIGAYMYTLLTGHCALDEEPANKDSDEWRAWVAHKTGYETAWTVMHMWGIAPGFRVIPDSPTSTSFTPTEAAGLSISFVNRPAGNVTVRVSTSNESVADYQPKELTFTPQNHSVAQKVSMLAVAGGPSQEVITITSTTESTDPAFNGIVDEWEYVAKQ